MACAQPFPSGLATFGQSSVFERVESVYHLFLLIVLCLRCNRLWVGFAY